MSKQQQTANIADSNVHCIRAHVRSEHGDVILPLDDNAAYLHRLAERLIAARNSRKIPPGT
jgi:hypothetical protein